MSRRLDAMTMFRALLSFKGRIGRLPFALAMVAVTLLAYAVPLRWLVDMAIHSLDPDYPLENIPLARGAPVVSNGLAATILVLAAALAIALAWTSLAALARRFHDLGLTAWLVVPAVGLAFLVPSFVAADLPPLGPLVLMIVMALVPGTPGANGYGGIVAAET